MLARRTTLISLLFAAVLLVACAAPIGANLPLAQIAPAPDLPSGRILFVKDGNLWLWTEGRARQITDGGTWQQPQWSPDGSEIAYVYRGVNFSDIFVMNADGSTNRRLTRSQSSSLGDNDWVFRPTWSPNGSQIAFVTDSDSYNPVVWVMNRDGTNRRLLMGVTDSFEAADALSWSPDGRRLAVTAFGADVSQIVLLDVGRGVTQPLTRNPKGVIDPAWSPDGRVIAIAVRDTGRSDIRLRLLDGGAEVELTRGGLSRAPAWSPDGRRLAYLSSKNGTFELYTVDLVDQGSGQLAAQNERQLTRDLNLDGTSGISWGR